MARRTEKKDGDYRDQLASDGGARRNEVLNRIRTADDAREVLSFIDQDLKENPKEKSSGKEGGRAPPRLSIRRAIAAFARLKKSTSTTL